MANFDQAIGVVLAHEGGYVFNPADPGGETNYGISKRCLDPAARVLTASLDWVPIEGIEHGDTLLGFDETPEIHGKLRLRRFRLSKVLTVGRVALPASQIVTDGRSIIASDDHLWLRRWGADRVFQWCRTADLLQPPGRWTNGVEVRLATFGDVWTHCTTREAGYLAGVLDSEGHVGTSLVFTQKANECATEALRCAGSLRITFRCDHRGDNGVNDYVLMNTSHRPFYPMWVAGYVGARRLQSRLAERLVGTSIVSRYTVHDVVKRVNSLGNRQLVAIRTSTNTVIVEGLLSHNSYPNLDIKNLTEDQAKEIYRRDYWRYDGIANQDVATKVFDMAVNMGPPAAHRLLQMALNALGQGVTVDGVFGPQTLAATNRADPARLLQELRAQAAVRYADIVLGNRAERTFLLGWMRRAVD